MKIKFTFLFLLQAYIFSAQISQEIRKLAKPLDSISYAESSHIGYGGEESKIYNYFKNLSKVASNDDLYYFAKNGSNSLRLYSSKELLKRNDRRFLEIYKFYSENPLIMRYQSGCVSSTENIIKLLNNEIFSAKEIISLRDSILKEKQEGVVIAQLKSIKEEGYDKLTQKNLEFYSTEIKKINSKK